MTKRPVHNGLHMLINQLKEENENLKNEVSALRQSVNSKTAAVNILRSELQDCQAEREKFHCIANNKSSIQHEKKITSFSGSSGENSLAQLYSTSKEENHILKDEVHQLKCKLHDAQADLKVLRQEKCKSSNSYKKVTSASQSHLLSQQEREHFISKLEAVDAKCRNLEENYRNIVEEREELIKARDEDANKIHRLNHMLASVINKKTLSTSKDGSPSNQVRVPDMDLIISENKYLHQRLKQSEEEKSLALQHTSKYKAALENTCNSKKPTKLGADNLILTSKQVTQLLKDYKSEMGDMADNDLKSLCGALVDTLNQRTRAAKTYKTANKMLLNRVEELEKQLCNHDDSNISSASSIFLENYVSPDCDVKDTEDMSTNPKVIEYINSKQRKENDTIDEKTSTDDFKKINNSGCPGSMKDNSSTFNNLSTTDNGGMDKSKKISKKQTNNLSNSETENEISISVQQSEELHKSLDGSLSKQNNKESNTSENSNNSDKLVDKKSSVLSENVLRCNSSLENKRKEDSKGDINNGDRTPIKSTMSQYKKESYTFERTNPNDDIEEIVPLDKFDFYMQKVREEQKYMKAVKASNEKLCNQKISSDTLEREKDIDQHCVEDNKGKHINNDNMYTSDVELTEMIKNTTLDKQKELTPENTSASCKTEVVPELKGDLIVKKTEIEKTVTEKSQQSKKIGNSKKCDSTIDKEPLNKDKIKKSSDENYKVSDTVPIQGNPLLADPFLKEIFESPVLKSDSESENSFQLDLSDYESDDDLLEATLNDWQKSQKVNTEDSGSPKKGISKLWKKSNNKNTDVPNLDELLK